MWNVTSEDSFKNQLEQEFISRWTRASNRTQDLYRVLYHSETCTFELNLLLKIWFEKGWSLEPVRNEIKKAIGGTSFIPLVEAYIACCQRKWSGAGSLVLLQGYKEKPLIFDASIFADKPYAFLNALYASFPHAVLSTPGLMEGSWKDNAYKNENLSTTMKSLLLGHHNMLVVRYALFYGEGIDEFFHQPFKSAFGVYPARQAIDFPLVSAVDQKDIKVFARKLLITHENKDGGVISCIRQTGRKDTWLITLLKQADIFSDQPLIKKITSSAGSTTLHNILVHQIIPLKKLGKYFSPIYFEKQHIDYLKCRGNDYFLEAANELIKGFDEEGQGYLHEKCGLPLGPSTKAIVKRRHLEDNLGL